MAVPTRQYNSIRAKKGKYVHAFSYQATGKTVCGRSMKGWICALTEVVNCPKCLKRLGRRCG